MFDGLSIFRPAAAVRLLKKSAAWAGPCLLCLGVSRGDRVCEACTLALPRSRLACPRCALPMVEGRACGRCLRHPPSFDATSAAFEYRFPIDRMVQRFKFGGDLAIGRWLGDRLAAAVASQPRPDLVVAAPLSRARLRERGFNQAVVLARIACAEHALPLETRTLEKVRDTRPQQGLSRAGRHANLRDAFRVRRPLQGARVALVDDVMTTGATAQAMAAALREAGARSVVAWVLARTPDPGH
jgi:ComF family protein